MAEDHGRQRARTLQLALEPRQLVVWNESLGPVEVSAAVWRTVRVEVAVQNDKLHAFDLERVVRLARRIAMVARVRKEVLLRDAVHVVVSKHMVARSLESRELRLDRVKEANRLRLKLFRRAPCLRLAASPPFRAHVLHVAQLDDEVEPRRVEGVHRLTHLRKRIAIVPRGTGPYGLVLFRVVGIGHHAEPHARTLVGAISGKGGRRRSARQKCLDERSSSHLHVPLCSTWIITSYRRSMYP